MHPVTTQRQACGAHRFDRAKPVALDARDLHQSFDWIARHAKMVFQCDLGGVLDLRGRAA